jgi:transcriptional regulator with XRE-family HTH domain
MPKSVFTEAYRALLDSLRSAREKAGASQSELARRLGVPQQFVSRVELGVRRLDVVEYYAVMKALGIDPAEAILALLQTFPEKVDI